MTRAEAPAASAAPCFAFLARDTVRRVLGLLDRDGEQARVVGGAVRNALMGLPISDIDIATTALPQEVMRRAKVAGIHAVPTGIDHGTVTLVIDGVPHEVTTLREDIETDGRHAVVRFGRDFTADALRRDFTINALSVDASGQVFDYAGGLADLAARRVRFIGEADQRIAEDALRILRFFRFSACYSDGRLDGEGMAAARRAQASLDRLSRERVRQETMKLMTAPQAGPVLAAMAEAGFLAPVLGAPGDVARFSRMAALEAALALAPDAARRLAALALFSTDDVPRLRERLRLTNGEVTRFEHLRADAAPSPGDPAAQKAALYRLGVDRYREAVLFHWAAGGASADDADLRAVFALPERWTAPRFLISGADILALGVPRGPEVGRRLAEAEARWIAAGMPEGRDAQAAIVDSIFL